MFGIRYKFAEAELKKIISHKNNKELLIYFFLAKKRQSNRIENLGLNKN